MLMCMLCIIRHQHEFFEKFELEYSIPMLTVTSTSTYHKKVKK